MKEYDIVIIGAGAAGMTAAIYALRGGKKTILLERENIGGQIALSPKVQNIPSIPEISGSDYADKIFSQISDLGADFELEEVLKIEKRENRFTVTTDYNEYSARAVILASGVKHRQLNVPGEERFLGKGVYYCALCDGAFYAGQEVALVGDGNTALQYALMLSDIASRLTVVTMFDKFLGAGRRASRQGKRRDNPGIRCGGDPGLKRVRGREIQGNHRRQTLRPEDRGAVRRDRAGGGRQTVPRARQDRQPGFHNNGRNDAHRRPRSLCRGRLPR